LHVSDPETQNSARGVGYLILQAEGIFEINAVLAGADADGIDAGARLDRVPPG
jgi:hypothetical protein